MACERIKAAITETLAGERPVKAILDAYNPTGSTRYVNFTTSQGDALADRRRANATSTGWSATATGRRSSAASPRPIRACAPTSRTRTSASRCPT